MIKAKTLKEMLSLVPDDAEIHAAEIHAYEGEGVGFAINMPDGTFEWISAYNSKTEDDQTEFSLKPHQIA